MRHLTTWDVHYKQKFNYPLLCFLQPLLQTICHNMLIKIHFYYERLSWCSNGFICCSLALGEFNSDSIYEAWIKILDSINTKEDTGFSRALGDNLNSGDIKPQPSLCCYQHPCAHHCNTRLKHQSCTGLGRALERKQALGSWEYKN